MNIHVFKCFVQSAFLHSRHFKIFFPEAIRQVGTYRKFDVHILLDRQALHFIISVKLYVLWRFRIRFSFLAIEKEKDIFDLIISSNRPERSERAIFVSDFNARYRCIMQRVKKRHIRCRERRRDVPTYFFSFVKSKYVRTAYQNWLFFLLSRFKLILLPNEFVSSSGFSLRSVTPTSGGVSSRIYLSLPLVSSFISVSRLKSFSLSSYFWKI